MKILLTGRTMTYLSGQPLYVFTTAIELVKRGHEVSVLSEWCDNQLRNKLLSYNVKCITEAEKEYDLILASEFKPDNVKGYVINIVHSEYDCETPIEDCQHYIAIRPSIKKHLIEEHKISSKKISVIYNGVDRERFSILPEDKKTKRNFKLTIVPCTIDKLREKFIKHLISISSPENMYIFVGRYFGADIKELTPYTVFLPEIFDIEKLIQNCDEVAGILLGRVNLEARSCGIPSIIYNPDTLKSIKYFPKEEIFNKKHNIINVVDNLLKIYDTKRK